MFVQNSSRDHDGHVINATWDLDFDPKMASDMKCCVIAGESVISIICRPGLVTSDAMTGAPMTRQTDMQTHPPTHRERDGPTDTQSTYRPSYSLYISILAEPAPGFAWEDSINCYFHLSLSSSTTHFMLSMHLDLITHFALTTSDGYELGSTRKSTQGCLAWS